MGFKNSVVPLFFNGNKMRSLAGSAEIHYYCVFYGKKMLYCYSNGDRELESFADLCLEKAPPFHSWYFHSTRTRTHGFLMENEHTCFAIADSGISSQELLKLLKYISHGYNKMLLLETECSEEPKTPLLSDKHDREKPKERASDASDIKVHFARTRGVDVGTSPDQTGTFRLWKSQSQQTSWMWLRQQLKMIIVADVILCLFLFMIG